MQKIPKYRQSSLFDFFQFPCDLKEHIVKTVKVLFFENICKILIIFVVVLIKNAIIVTLVKYIQLIG